MRSQLQRVYDALKNKPDGLTILQLTTTINKGLDSEFSASTVTYWTKEAVKQGVIEKTVRSGKKGRPAQVFKIVQQ